MNQKLKTKLLVFSGVLSLGVGALLVGQIDNAAADDGQTASAPLAFVEPAVNNLDNSTIELIQVDEEDGYDEYDPYQIAADVIGIDIDALFEAMDEGKTIAEVATENGVDVQAVVDALVEAENSFIDQLVADSEIDAEEAAEWKAETAEYINELVNESWDDLYFEFDEGADPYQVAADTIGIDVEALFTALEDGKTIADVATENGVDVQTVVDALVEAENSFIDQLVADGEIDAEEAAEWKAETAEYINELVNESWDDLYFEFEEGADPLETAATTIGVDIETLYNAIDNGQTIAEVAAENGVEAQAVIDAMITAENEFIDELAAAGDISAEEADEWRSEVAEYTAEMVNESWDELFEECDEFEDEAVHEDA